MTALIILELLYLSLNLLYDYDRISKHIPVRHPIDTVPVYIIYATTMLMCMYAQDIPAAEIVKNAFELAGVRWLVHSTGLAYLRNLPLDYIDTEHDISFTDKLLARIPLHPVLVRGLTLLTILIITRIIL